MWGGWNGGGVARLWVGVGTSTYRMGGVWVVVGGGPPPPYLVAMHNLLVARALALFI